MNSKKVKVQTDYEWKTTRESTEETCTTLSHLSVQGVPDGTCVYVGRSRSTNGVRVRWADDGPSIGSYCDDPHPQQVTKFRSFGGTGTVTFTVTNVHRDHLGDTVVLSHPLTLVEVRFRDVSEWQSLVSTLQKVSIYEEFNNTETNYFYRSSKSLLIQNENVSLFSGFIWQGFIMYIVYVYKNFKIQKCDWLLKMNRKHFIPECKCFNLKTRTRLSTLRKNTNKILTLTSWSYLVLFENRTFEPMKNKSMNLRV